jgi:hypothetical protein
MLYKKRAGMPVYGSGIAPDHVKRRNKNGKYLLFRNLNGDEAGCLYGLYSEECQEGSFDRKCADPDRFAVPKKTMCGSTREVLFSTPGISGPNTIGRSRHIGVFKK